MAVENKHTQKLKALVKDEVTKMFEEILNFTQVACPEPQFKPLRSRILRIGNNCIRNIHKKLDDHYKIEFVTTAEDIIEVQRKK